MGKMEREPESKIYPRASRVPHDRYGKMPNVPKSVNRVLREVRKVESARRSAARGGPRIPGKLVVVRVSGLYPRHERGGWRAHGRYLDRNVGQPERPWEVFDATGTVEDPVAVMSEWWDERDSRAYKVVISPGDASRLDLKELTRDVMARAEAELCSHRFVCGIPAGSKLEWIAACHYDTPHPHVHLTLRARAGGKEFLLSQHRDIFRQHAALAIARQLGFEQQYQAGIDRKKAERTME